MPTRIYLDHAAATPLDPRVLEAMHPYLTAHFANPSSPYAAGRDQHAALEAARKRIARTLGAKPAEIVFTSGSTEAANLAVLGVMQAHPNARAVASTIEHDTVLGPLAALERAGRQTGLITVQPSGVVDPGQVAAGITDLTVLVCVQYVNNEVGTIQPLARIAAEVQRIREDRIARGIILPLYLYCDAAQAGLQNLQVARLGVDMMSMGGAKLYGPPGSGFLYVRTGTKLAPVWFGGGQENGLRPGTENVAAAAGLATALEFVQTGRGAEAQRQAGLRDWLWGELQAKLPDLVLNGEARHRAAGFLNLTIPGADGEALVAHLDAAGVAVATGSACTAAHQDPSHVLLAIGRTPAEAASSLRLTLGKDTTKADIRRAAGEIVRTVARVRQLTAKHRV